MNLDQQAYKIIGDMPDNIKWEWSEILVKVFFNSFSKVMPPGDAIDLGANFGIHSWNLGHIVKKTNNTLVSVEPDERCYEFLNQVFSKGNFKNLLIKNPISDESKLVTFCIDPDTQLNRICDDSLTNDRITVQTVTLDEIAKGYSPKYIKIDVEGQDINTIKGGQLTIKTHRPIISTEWSLSYSKEDQIWYYNFFKKLDYTMIDFLGNEYDSEHWVSEWSPYWNRFLIPNEYKEFIKDFKTQANYMFEHQGIEGLIKLNPVLCAYPWNAATVRPNGDVLPCCRYNSSDNPNILIDSRDPRDSKQWSKLRENMLAGKASEGCNSCYKDENSGLVSMRQDSLNDFIPIKNETASLTRLEISFSNLCNLACAHCSSYFSTKWWTEDVINGRAEKNGIIENKFNFDQWDLSKLTELKIIGGEPFMEQNRFIDLLKKLNLSNINIQICTNGTIMPNNELKSLIESCKNVYLCVSLDGLGTTNDWYRWPSKFSDVVDNMKTYESWWHASSNVFPIVHHVINAVNILELEDFVSYMSKEFPKWRIEWDWIRWPAWQELSVLPKYIKEKLISRFTLLDLEYQKNIYITSPYKISIERLQSVPSSNWKTLKLEIEKLSTERNLNFLDMVSSYKKFWELTYDENGNVSDTYCPLAWNHMSAHADGTMRVCCNATAEGRLKKDNKYLKINEITSLIDFYNIDQFKTIRKNMLANKRSAECQHCYNVEDNGGESVRQWFIKKWPIEDTVSNTDLFTGELSSVNINYLDLSWSNKCNLQCKMCTPDASDQLIKEFKFINITPWSEDNSNNKDTWEHDQIADILKAVQTRELTQILVTGGEPLINNEFYVFCKELISSGLSSQIELSIHTNLTVTPSKWIDIWKHFKTMTIKISIDAVGEMYEYNRYPGKWNIVKENINSIVQYSNENENVGIEFHTVFSIFNTHRFTELLDYIVSLEGKNIINFPHTNYIYYPNHASPSNLPKPYKDEVYREIMDWIDANKVKIVGELSLQKVKLLEAIITLFVETTTSAKEFNRCVSIIKKMDKYRGHDTSKFLPWWNNIEHNFLASQNSLTHR